MAAMAAVFRPMKERRARVNEDRTGEYCGAVDVHEEPLTELRFADDVLLMASCKRDVIKMICNLARESAQAAHGEDRNFHKCPFFTPFPYQTLRK